MILIFNKVTMKSRKEISAIIKGIKKQLGPTRPVVLFRSSFQTLIATVLSARTKDTTTYPASKRLFAKFPNPKKLSKADAGQIEKLIFPVGFYRTKAKRIKEISKILLEKFNGKVPKNIEDLTSLPGVGRKTAACVLVFAYKIPDIPVDVHVAVMSHRLGFTKEKNPDKIRVDLMKKIPKQYWLDLNELMVKYGQRICLTRNPKCGICGINKLCEYYSERNQ